MKKTLAILFLVFFLFPLIHTTSGCTIISQQVGDTVLFGNNEDYLLENTVIGFIPAQSSSYGYMYLGFNRNNDSADGYPQGTLNDQGLACDGNGLPAAFRFLPGRLYHHRVFSARLVLPGLGLS